MVGITETKKMVECVRSNLLGLISIDYDQVLVELKDLDGEEKRELLVMIGQEVIEILMAARMAKSSGAIFSTVLKKMS